MGGVVKERNDWTEDGRYPSRFYKTSLSAEQQEGTLSLEEEIAKGTVGRTVRGGERDRYKDRERHNRNEREADQEIRQNRPAEQGGTAVRVSKPSSLP